jgi:hypothetical protein
VSLRDRLYNRSAAGRERSRRYERMHPERRRRLLERLEDREVAIADIAHAARLSPAQVAEVLDGRGTAWARRDVAEALGIDDRDL